MNLYHRGGLVQLDLEPGILGTQAGNLVELGVTRLSGPAGSRVLLAR